MVPQLARTRHTSPTYREQSPTMVPPVVPLFPYIAPLVVTSHHIWHHHSQQCKGSLLIYYYSPTIAYRSPDDVVQWSHQLSSIFVTCNKFSYFQHESSPTSGMVWLLEDFVHFIANPLRHIVCVFLICKITYDRWGRRWSPCRCDWGISDQDLLKQSSSYCSYKLTHSSMGEINRLWSLSWCQ